MPNIHPLLVHFPVALLLFSFAAELTALARRDTRFSFVGWWAQLVGTAMIGAAVISGILAGNGGTIRPDAYPLYADHQQMAFLTTAIFSILLLWRIGTRASLPSSWRWLYLLLFAAGVVFVLRTAWLGGALVYRFGTAVS